MDAVTGRIQGVMLMWIDDLFEIAVCVGITVIIMKFLLEVVL